MSLVVVGSAKGAPGVTTLATALAAVWPQTAVLADCDPAGGDIALRLRDSTGGWLARQRGIVGLAASAQVRAHDDAEVDLAGQVQLATGGLPVLVGVDSAAQSAAMGSVWPTIARALATSADLDDAGQGVVIADCGRLVPGQPSEHLLARASAVVLATHPSVEGVAHLRHLLAHVTPVLPATAPGASVVWVAVTGAAETARRDTADVATALTDAGHPGVLVRAIPHDPRAALALAGTPTKGLDRSALVAAARRLAAELHTTVQAPPGARGTASAVSLDLTAHANGHGRSDVLPDLSVEVR